MHTRSTTHSLLAALALVTLATTGCGLTDSSEGGWKDVDAPTKDVTIKAINFHDAQRGWLSAEGTSGVDSKGAWYTSDGGDSWDQRKGPYDALVTKFSADGQRTWLSGRDNRGIWYADDQSDFKPAEGEFEYPDSARVMHFWDAETGIFGSNTGDRIHRTTDGGESFTLEEFGRDTAPGMNDLTAAGDQVWIATGTEFTEDGSGGPLLYSDDRGKTWREVNFEDEAHDYAGGAILGVHAVDGSEVWAAGVNRQLYFTKDGMETWQQVQGIPKEAPRFEAIDGVGDHLMAAGNYKDDPFIFESTDGGENWQIVDLGDTCTDGCRIEGIEMVTSDLAFAYGPNNTLLRYDG
jgi:photosystem II stability/assembly factor-like uncharacterized protein